MSSSVLVTPRSPGAGRMWDVVYPDPLVSHWGGPTIQSRARNSSAVAGTTTTSNGTGWFRGWWQYNGVDALKYVSGSGAAGQTIADYCDQWLIRFPTQKHGIPGGIVNDFNVWRVYAILAWETVPGLACDYGLQCVLQNNGITGNMYASNAQGLGFNRDADGNIYLATRGTTFQKFQLTGPGSQFPTLDVTKFNVFELRFIGATATTDAAVKVLINNTPVSGLPALNWANGGGALLPSRAGTTDFRVFPVVAAVNAAGAGINAGMYLHQLRIIAAPTESATL